jgi:cytochrome c oxidase subunit 3
MAIGADPSGSVPAPDGAAWTHMVRGLGMIVFLALDLMLFAAFFSASFVLRGTARTWPPSDVDLAVPRATAATFVLVGSAFTLLVAERALEHDRRRTARQWLLVTIALGAAFLVNQTLEYGTLDFRVESHPYGSGFWLLTGLHGLHVLAGLLVLALLLLRVARVDTLTSLAPFATSASAYWHLVVVVWAAVLTAIWVLR